MASGSKRVIGRKVLTAAFATGSPVQCEYCKQRVYRRGGNYYVALAVADHRVPLSRGGLDVEENIAIACEKCDADKGPLTGDEFERLRTSPQERKQLILFVLASIRGRAERAEHVRQSRRSDSLVRKRAYRSGQVPGGRSVDRELRRQSREWRAS